MDIIETESTTIIVETDSSSTVIIDGGDVTVITVGEQGPPGSGGGLTLAESEELSNGSVTELHKHDFDDITFPTQWTLGTMDHVYTLQELMNHQWSAGIVNGVDITLNGDGTASFSAGEAVIRAVADGHTTLYGVKLQAQLNMVFVDNSINYVYLDYNAGVPYLVSSPSITSFNCMDKCIAYAVHRNGNVLHYLDAREQNVDSNRKMRQMFLKYSRFIHSAGGTVLSATGLALKLTSGSFFFMLQEINHAAFDTSVVGTANENVFTLWNRVAGVFTATEGSKVINTTLYDNGTNPTLIPLNDYGVSWVYVVNDAPSELHVVMGQTDYAKLSDALIATPPSSVPTIVAGMGALVGFVVYERGVTVFDDVRSAFIQTFGTATPVDLSGYELLVNKSTSVEVDKTSDIKYPTVKAVYDWVSSYVGFPINDIGRPNTAGFGQGICPALPAGYTPLAGYTEPLNANWGTYQYSDGSIMVWVPAFFLRIGHVNNPTYATYGVNSISIVSIGTYASDATANVAGYYRHRAFINGGVNQLGFFRDKYDCSNNGGIASSVANAMPVVSGPATGQVGFNSLTGAPANAFYGSINAAKTRGTKFFPESTFIADALSKISLAQAQAATATTYCAWYDAAGVINYPKGNDNNALSCGVDLTVTFTTAGASSYPNFALTGSGSPFAKTTHNGQVCGITDVAGNISKVILGITALTGTAKTITGATQANPVNITAVAHGYTTGWIIDIMSVGGMTVLNNKMFQITVVDADNFTLDGVDGTAFAAYTTGGSAYSCQYYALKESVDIATITSGNTAATDHWGTAGLAANFDAITINFNTAYPNNGYAQKFGNGTNAVFDMSTAANRLLTMMGLPAAGGMSTTGTNAMGQDYYYIDYPTASMCATSSGNWSLGSIDGVHYRRLSDLRTSSFAGTGFACASYL